MTEKAKVTREEWRDIKGYEGLYQISEFGKVKSLERKVNGPKGLRIVEEKILKPYIGTGYKKVHLSKSGKGKQISVHRLVATNFIREPVGREVVNHIDGNKLNNHYSNLEWCTYRENNQHARENGLWKAFGSNHYLRKQTSRNSQTKVRVKTGISINKGETNGRAKLSENDVLEIRNLYKNGISMNEIAKVYGIGKTSVYLIIHKKVWRHIS